MLDTNETLKNEITKLEKVRNETERLVSTVNDDDNIANNIDNNDNKNKTIFRIIIMLDTNETKNEIMKLEKVGNETERLVSMDNDDDNIDNTVP